MILYNIYNIIVKMKNSLLYYVYLFIMIIFAFSLLKLGLYIVFGTLLALLTINFFYDKDNNYQTYIYY
jgi:hypothetical protein